MLSFIDPSISNWYTNDIGPIRTCQGLLFLLGRLIVSIYLNSKTNSEPGFVYFFWKRLIIQYLKKTTETAPTKDQTRTRVSINVHAMAAFLNSSLPNSTTFRCEHREFCVRYRESAFYIESIVTTLTIIDVFLIATTLAINGIFIFSSFLYENLRNSSNFLLLNLAVIDFMFGAAGLIVCCLFQLQFIGCQTRICFYKDLYVHFFGTGMALTMMTFTFISIERYVCIFYALRWMDIVTKKTVALAICIVWIYTVGVTTICRIFDSWNVFEEIYLIQFVINILIILITNLRIFQEIRRHEKRIKQEQVAPNSEEIRKTRERKRAKTIILMILLMIVCYLPAMLIIAAKKIPSVDNVQLQYGWMACRTISLSHSTFDFLVYGLKTEEIRRAFRKILGTCFCKENRVHVNERQTERQPSQPSQLEQGSC